MMHHAQVRSSRKTHFITDRKSTRLNSSHEWISYAVFCLKKKTRLAGAHRHRRGHLRLDEPGRDGVDRLALLGEQRRQRVDDADHARLGGGVVGMAAVADD